jgi:hypothetical protein
MKIADEVRRLHVRVPADLAAEVAAIGRRNDRELSAEVRHALRRHVEREALRGRYADYAEYEAAMRAERAEYDAAMRADYAEYLAAMRAERMGEPEVPAGE